MSDSEQIQRLAMFAFKQSMRNLLLYGHDPLIAEVARAHSISVRQQPEHERLLDAWSDVEPKL